MGNAVGGLLTGSVVSRTGRYKVPILIATMLGNTCYILVLARWHGSTSWLDTSYLFLGGFGMGSTQNTTFVHLAAALKAKDMAVAGTSWFLSQSLGMLVAVNIFNVVHNSTFTSCLKSSLDGIPIKEEVNVSRWPTTQLELMKTRRSSGELLGVSSSSSSCHLPFIGSSSSPLCGAWCQQTVSPYPYDVCRS